MPTSIVSITFLVGLALIVVALLGGGIEVKEIKIPTLLLLYLHVKWSPIQALRAL